MGNTYSKDNYMEIIKARFLIEKEHEWMKWHKEVPYIQWPSDWLVKAVPPFGGAVIRYNIKHVDKPDSFVSVYLDCYDEIGCVGQPYWEIYPIGGECERYMMDETDQLIDGIKRSLNAQ